VQFIYYFRFCKIFTVTKMCIFVCMNLKNIILLCLYGVMMLVYTACGQKDNATTQNLSKENSVEIVVTTKHLNEKYDLVKTTRRVYLENKLIKETSSFDTIPALGRGKVEDEDGKIKSVQKDYDIFVTVQ